MNVLALERAEITQLSNVVGYFIQPPRALERAEITQLSNGSTTENVAGTALERAEITQLSNPGMATIPLMPCFRTSRNYTALKRFRQSRNKVCRFRTSRNYTALKLGLQM